jgi:hypothetical protein
MLQRLADAPDFVRNADFLTLDEQVALVSAGVVADEDIIRRAQQFVVDEFRRRRRTPSAEAADHDPLESATVIEALAEAIDRIGVAQRQDDEDALFADGDALLAMILDALDAQRSLAGRIIDGRPAEEVLRERLGALDRPEFCLLAVLLIDDSVVTPVERWFCAARES